MVQNKTGNFRKHNVEAR